MSQLEKAVEDGLPLWPWQSKLIDREVYEDPMFNDPGILHFHLGTGFETTGYIDRTGELLFALVAQGEFYELGIFHHGDWCDLDLLDTLDSNWPTLLDPFTISALDSGLAPKTSADVREMRKFKVNSAFTLNSGRIIFSPGGGQSSDGTSTEAVFNAQRWSKRFRRWESMISEDIRLQVEQGILEDTDHSVVLELNDARISAWIPGLLRWILWKRRDEAFEIPDELPVSGVPL